MLFVKMVCLTVAAARCVCQTQEAVPVTDKAVVAVASFLINRVGIVWNFRVTPQWAKIC
jgi:hypothetical protein